jgi:FkbM family methyltransferase
MTKFIAAKLLSLSAILLSFSKLFHTPTQEKRTRIWFKIRGDQTLRLNYDQLDEKSIVFDAGGYEGQWTSDIYSKYNCSIYVFEPVKSYFKCIEERFKKNNKINVFCFGLGNKNISTVINLDQASSSVYKKGEKSETIKIVNITSFLKKNRISSIDLFKINIEGSEYDLLDELIRSGDILKIKNLQVQFHDFTSDSYQRMKRLHFLLSKTHFTTYSYPFVWENWRIKSD